jgi:ATP-dependent Clp protease ATP-binding subunit ClpC
MLSALLLVDGPHLAILTNLGCDPALLKSRLEYLISQKPESKKTGDPRNLPFTPAAKHTLERSMEEANYLEQRYIGTEHLLLGLLHSDTGLARQSLDEFGMNLDNTRKALAEMFGIPLSTVPFQSAGEMIAAQRPESFLAQQSQIFDRFTNGARIVLNMALRRAIKQRNNHVGTEHVLFALLDRP